MPVPPFEPAGFLPAGRHPCTVEEVETSLVDAIGASSSRRLIFDWWRMHRASLRHLMPYGPQWVDGSFVTTKVDPGDVDLMTILDGPAFDALAIEVRWLVKSLVSGQYTRAFWRCDSYPVFRYPSGHPLHDAGEAALAYWADWWGHTRDTDPGGKQPKGYLEVA